MRYIDKTCSTFVAALASKEPVPGGGSVSALVGALGAALGSMVGALTVGKKTYADVEEEIRQCMTKVLHLQNDLIELVQRDIDIFEPLSRLYGMKAETPEEKERKDVLLEKTLEDACMVPLEIMEKCADVIVLSKIFAEKGSRIAVSDAGASAILSKGAMQAASLNVFINTGSMKDKTRAGELNARCDALMAEYEAMADEVFKYVQKRLRG